MSGSVYKRCPCFPNGSASPCQKKHGAWVYVVSVRDPGSRKRRQVRKGGFTTRRGAEEALAELVVSVNQGAVVPSDKQTAEAFLNGWLDQKLRNGLRPSTASGYRRHIDFVLVPVFGDVALRDVRAHHIEAALNYYADGHASPGGRKPSAASVRRLHATIRSAMATAKTQRKIAFNPAFDLELPKASRPKVQPWEPAELGAFLDHAAGDVLGSFFELVAATGLRRGEAVGVMWSDIDLEAGTLTVNRQIQSRKDAPACPVCSRVHRGIAFELPKTDAGERVVDLDSRTIGVLLGHRLAQDELRAKWGAGYDDHDLLFCREDGAPLHPEQVSHHFARLVREVRFPDDAHLPDDDRRRLRLIRLHDLRHGQASLLMAAGVSLGIVSKRLGHASVQITSDTYSHLLKGVGRDAAEAAAALVPRAVTADVRDSECDRIVTGSGNSGASSK